MTRPQWHPKVHDAMFGEKSLRIERGGEHAVTIVPPYPFYWQRIDFTNLSHWGGPEGYQGVMLRASVHVSMVFDADMHISVGRYVASMTRLTFSHFTCQASQSLSFVILNKTPDPVTVQNLAVVGFEFR